MANIRLNILPISENNFSFTIYRKEKGEDDTKQEGIYVYHLPIDNNTNERKQYLVSFEEQEEFQKYEANSFYAIGLTKRYLLKLLLNSLKINGCSLNYEIKRKFTEQQIEFTLQETKQGRQIIFLQPYYLEERKRFGVLIDFKFSKNKDYPFDKEVQTLSLSLDNQGRSNKNFYTDKFNLVQGFIDNTHSSIQHLSENIKLEKELIESPVFSLSKKEYVFSNKSTANSQFQGIRNFGPYKEIDQEVLFVFVFEDKYKSFANELYLSLIGKLNPGTFPGLEQMFGVKISTENVKQVKITGYSQEEFLNVINKIKDLQKSVPNKKVIGIYIEDYVINGEDEETSNDYYFLKYNFIKNNIPLQVVNYRKLGERNSLKWSTSNLALAMFAKMGGIPWLVKPSNNDCLILGIGSSHKIDIETKSISKYFAYTVCLDSSGLYQTLEVLAEETTEANYLEQLKSNIVKLFKNEKIKSYKTCVLHLPFKIKKKEISAISEAINEISEIEFVTIKINLKNKYFGYSNHNTLVPYESSFVKLSYNEYLVWFEGLLYGKEVVYKRLSNPVHIQFLNRIEDSKRYLQDVLNLSGANWRGFNAKSIPISIYYSQIIAKYTEAFEQIEDYEETAISNDKPWFL